MKLLSLAALVAFKLSAATTSVTASFPIFTPAQVTITAGDTVHWTGLVGHNVAEVPSDTSTTHVSGFYSGPVPSTSNPFDFQFNTPGTYYYICEAHAVSFGMRGAVFVLPADTPTATPTATQSQTPNGTFTDSPTETPTFSDSPTANGTFTDTPTATPTATPTITPSVTATGVAYPASPVGYSVFAPVPVKIGVPLCLAFKTAPFRNHVELYNSRGERVLKAEFGSEQNQCLPTDGLAPGLYFARLDEEDAAQIHRPRLQKIVVLR